MAKKYVAILTKAEHRALTKVLKRALTNKDPDSYVRFPLQDALSRTVKKFKLSDVVG